jgi:hypothetical protein
MRFMQVLAACYMAVVYIGTTTAAEGSRTREVYLAQANSFYEEGEWLAALQWYRSVRALRADLRQHDEICCRIARCSELGRSRLHGLLPAGLGCELVYGDKIMRWLRDTYGYYVEESEGDACWVYDQRALRELLRLHPESSYADEAEYVLIKYSFGIDPGMRTDRAESYAPVVQLYERLLERYPDTNLRADIVAEMAFLRDPTGEHAEWIWHYWHTRGVRYP